MTVSIKSAYRIPLIVAGVVILLIGSFLLGAGSARSQGRTGVTLTAAGAGGKITVTGTGTVTGTPDELQLSMGVQVNAGNVSSALSQANQAISAVTRALESGGVQAADIATSGLSIYPNFRNGSQAPIGYGVNEQITATLRHLSQAGTQIQAAVTAGGDSTTVQGVSLNFSDTSTLLASARTKAVSDAQAKAVQFASALHRPLGAVVSISDQTSFPVFYGDAYSAKAAAGAPVPISPGTQQLSIQVTVVYAIG